MCDESKTHCTDRRRDARALIHVFSSTKLQLHCCRIHRVEFIVIFFLFVFSFLLLFFSLSLVCKFLHYIFIWKPWSIGIVPKCNQFEKSRLLCQLIIIISSKPDWVWCVRALVSHLKLFPSLLFLNVVFSPHQMKVVHSRVDFERGIDPIWNQATQFSSCDICRFNQIAPQISLKLFRFNVTFWNWLCVIDWMTPKQQWQRKASHCIKFRLHKQQWNYPSDKR